MFWSGELIARNAPTRRRPTVRPGLADRAEAAYLGLAIGDALGATVEFMTPREIRERHGVHRDIVGGGWLRLKAGQVTDDTTMSLALGEAILQRGGVDARAAADAFDAWMRAKPVDIGNTVRRNLVSYRKTGNPAAPASEHDAGNGAVMRLLPVALACHGRPPAERFAAARAQAHVTHNNPLSDAAGETLLLMLGDLLDGASADEVERRHAMPLVAARPIFAYDRKRSENPSGYVVDTLQAVFQSFFATANFEDCLTEVVNRGGDADTTGAIAGMLAGACYGMAGLPRRWINGLEPGIRAQCSEQAAALVSLAAAQPAPDYALQAARA